MPDGSYSWAPPPFGWAKPADSARNEFQRRADLLARLRAEPERLPLVAQFYAAKPAAFICDWGCTYDPRNVRLKIPVLMPLVLFKRQVDLIDFVLARWQAGEDGVVKKCRDVGFTWVMVSLFCTLGIFNIGFRAGLGSRKAEYVDTLNDPKALIPKARDFMRHLPTEFRGTWADKDAPHMRLLIPDTQASLGGEAGAAIGRGDRTSVHLVDEYAHFEPADARGAKAALSQTTNCCIYGSSVNGMNNEFAEEYHSGRVPTFDFEWWDDPRKDRAWYEAEKESTDPVVFAQEVDCDWQASVEGVIIPAEWVAAALDAHAKLNLSTSGARFAALDVADEGLDANALVGASGVVIDYLDRWSGKGSDTFATAERAFRQCDERGYRRLRYDADGLGASVRGDARVINERRQGKGQPKVEVEAFRGSGEIVDPTGKVEGIRDGGDDRLAPTNEDFFANAKAQGWWDLRRRFQKTFRAVTQGGRYRSDELISISSASPLHRTLMTELSQPTRTFHAGTGKMVVNKTPDGTKSPNLADGAMMRFARLKSAAHSIDPAVLARL